MLYAGCDLVDALDANDPLLHPLLSALEDAWNQVDLRQPASALLDDTASHALAGLRERLGELRAAFTPAERPSVTAIGHGHLDVAWLWQTRHTREKAARTFSVATALMQQYPEYIYLHTTPQVYAWLEQDYPHIFAQVKERVAEGRIEAGGAMWLEPDTNIVSGEALVRQIMYGQRYLRETFGREYDVLWLPDSFGYSYSLPQIMLRAGLQSIMTIKMSWRDSTNRLPYDTFRWRGLDGSETLAHFVTTPWLPGDADFVNDFDNDTYSARFIVPALRRLWERYRNKAQNSDLLFIYGRGDGGAGPTRQHLERYRALRELPGLPNLHLGRADDYFHALRQRVWDDPSLPIWDGELYLEYHRGVYTTQAWLKRLHRRIEERLLLAESLDAARWAHARIDGGAAPDERATLDDAWRVLLLHEFHDILPGSSIGPVYDDARIALTTLAERLDSFITQAERDVSAPDTASSASEGDWLLHNPSPCATPGDCAVVQLPLAAGMPLPALTIEGHTLPAQEVSDPTGQRFALVASPPVAGRGWLRLREATSAPDTQRAAQLEAPGADESALSATLSAEGGAVLENARYRMRLDAQGCIISLRDKRAPGRRLIAAGRLGNHFVAFDDRPLEFDAWDIDATYPQKPYPMQTATLSVTERGPVRATVHVSQRFMESVIEQDISLYHDLPRIDFATRIDWRKHHLLLKVAFPLDLRATLARSEIQYGSVTRPTHRNTSWDQARFETVAHRWVDLSEGAYGVALLNDGRYGHDIHDSVVRLTLLRSPTSPDPDADQGAHELTYSLLPHQGAWPAGDVIAHGYALNRPLRAVRLSPATASSATTEATVTPTPQPLFEVDSSTVILEAVKRAAEGDDLIVRLYESTGSRTSASVTSAIPLASVIETDLLERPLEQGISPAYGMWQASPAASHDTPLVSKASWTCQFRPFEWGRAQGALPAFQMSEQTAK